MRLYVGNLAETATQKCLRDLFGRYGMHGECSITRGGKRAFAIVHVEDGDKAVADLDGKEVEGNVLRVSKAVDRTKQCSNA